MKNQRNDWLLPHAFSLVHHGGCSMTSSGFCAGIPMPVIPHSTDQFIGGSSGAQLAVDPQPILHLKLIVGNMSAALREMQPTAIHQKAAYLGASIRTEPDAVAEAVGMKSNQSPVPKGMLREALVFCCPE